MSHEIASYEEEFALDLLLDNRLFSQAIIIMTAMQAAVGTGRIPISWFRAITETDSEAENLAAQVNMERLARRVWGS